MAQTKPQGARSRRRARADAVPQDADRRLAATQAAMAHKLLQHFGIRGGAAVLDLCCGLGRQAAGLARAGFHVIGIDLRCDDAVLRQWRLRLSKTDRLSFISADARHLPLGGPIEAVLLLHNALALFNDNDDVIAVFSEIRRIISPRGVLVVDNCCLRLWREIAAGRYADGISEDGLWQMAWLRGRNVFALRYGDSVNPDRPRPHKSEPLYRAWSLDELDLLCRLTGWCLDRHSWNRWALVARPK